MPALSNGMTKIVLELKKEIEILLANTRHLWFNSVFQVTEIWPTGKYTFVDKTTSNKQQVVPKPMTKPDRPFMYILHAHQKAHLSMLARTK